MPRGQYLRTNYRRTGGELDAIALGKGLVLGSAGGSGVGGQGGGCKMAPFVMGSWSGTATSNTISIVAGSALASFYGCDKVGEGSGYRIMPFFVQSKVATETGASCQSQFLFIASLSASVGASQFFIYLGGSDTSMLTSDWSAHFYWVGLVVSAP